jgi:glyoxylase-like metal-dependent hydrolase (beta-lactamase superfamily II)
MAKIHVIRTGFVQVRQAQASSKGHGIARTVNMLIDSEWTDWLPIYAWAIEHRGRVVLVDTGETSRVHELGYHPGWHPFYRSDVILTHLHTDHAGGLRHVVGSRTWVNDSELKRAQGIMGRLNGYLPHRWPKWWQPSALQFKDGPVGPFPRSADVTGSGEILVIPTPGHTPGHVSVLVQGSPSILLAGDTSYTQDLLLAGKVDGVSPDEQVSRKTLGDIRELARQRPLVYLPSHDPECESRLNASLTLPE